MRELLAEPPFIVLRAARGVPPGWMPAYLEGRWYNRAELLRDHLPAFVARPIGPGAIALPTGRVEHRDGDGASAEVWEVHPPGGNYANDGEPDPWPP